MRVVRKPNVLLPLKAWKLVLPYMYLRESLYATSGQHVHNMPRANLGRAKVETEVATVGKVPVTLAPSRRQNNGAVTAEAIQVGNVGQSVSQKMKR